MSSVWDIANPQLRDLVAYEPGRPIEDVARDLGLDPAGIVKLASNENALGPSPRAKEAMRDALENAHLYPDGGGFRLRNAIADKFGLARENIVLGNGSNEIIELIGHSFLRPGDNIIAAEHAFVVYRLMATLFGADTIEVPDPGYHHDLDAMAAAVTDRTREIFVANPNNPTGTLVTEEQIEWFLDKVPPHVMVVFDEAYYEFLKEPPDTLRFVREGRNIVVLRTFSKIQGLASLRIGYGMASPEVAEVLQKARQPFNANAIAQAGALAGLLDDEHQERTREMNFAGLELFHRSFAEMELEFVPSHGNFVLVNVGDGDRVFEELMKRGIIVRAMRAYKLPEWVRVTVGRPEENKRFLTELKDLLGLND